MKPLLSIFEFAFVYSFTFLLSVSAYAEAIRGKVVVVSDGDTIVVLSEGKIQNKIRLAEIDAPEKGQPWGQVSRQVLSDLVFGKEVTVEKMNVDRYGRVVGKVSRDNDKLNVNAEMVKRGMAWVYIQYNKNLEMPPLEAVAREQKVGLWADKNPTAPWAFRKDGKKSNKVSMLNHPQPQKSNTLFTCAGKKTCKQMSSCEEAKFYLQQCNLKSLDGNGDGTPCRSLCSKR